MYTYKHMDKKNRVATTVKVDSTTYDELKVLGIRYKLTLQGLVEKTVYRYVNEETFRDAMNSFVVPIVLDNGPINITGSVA